ncbi:MAG TPA: hypothetical protein VFQ72_02915 [Candidatus Paceibacterota bacterium]|nr:hypothetical protein [Candidatus Paceibacterota bacterium]
MKKISVVVVLVLLVAAGIWCFRAVGRGGDGEVLCGLDACAPTGRVMSIEDYLRLNISGLSPVKASLGGTFYVTDVQAHGGAGTVKYEDGHSAYIADFTYSIDEDAGIAVDTFKVRP